MKRIAVFVEGHCALVFVRSMLTLVFDNSKLSFSCFEWRSHTIRPVSYGHQPPDPEIHFLIVDAAGDQAVLSAIKEREKGLFQKGYQIIIGLRDMYSEAYVTRAGRTIDNKVIRQFVEGWQKTIATMSNPDKIRLHLSIMELEAWFLGMYPIFPRLHPTLSIDSIKSQLGHDLRRCDPQTEFFHPSRILSEILQSVGDQYKKSRSDIERICSHIEASDFAKATDNGRCTCLREFHAEVLNCWRQ